MMPSLAPSNPITARQLWEMGEGANHLELDEGVLLHMTPSGPRHGRAVARLTHLLEAFVEQHGLGAVFGAETGFELRPDCVRAPDISFVRADRLPPGEFEEGFFPGPPDLAVEVLSPGDRPGSVLRKVAQYLEAGTGLVWVLDPKRRTAVIHRSDGSIEVLGPENSLGGEARLPGFSCALASILP